MRLIIDPNRTVSVNSFTYCNIVEADGGQHMRTHVRVPNEEVSLCNLHPTPKLTSVELVDIRPEELLTVLKHRLCDLIYRCPVAPKALFAVRYENEFLVQTYTVDEFTTAIWCEANAGKE